MNNSRDRKGGWIKKGSRAMMDFGRQEREHTPDIDKLLTSTHMHARTHNTHMASGLDLTDHVIHTGDT